MNEWLQIFSFPKSSKNGRSITDAGAPTSSVVGGDGDEKVTIRPRDDARP